MSNSWQIAITVFANLLLGVVQLLLFEAIRVTKRYVYAPRTHPANPHRPRTPPKPSTNLFGWWRAVHKVGEREEIAAGLDVLVMVRVIRLCFRTSVFGCMVACVLVPLFAIGHGKQTDIDRVSILNLDPTTEAQKYWVVVVACYSITLHFLYLLKIEYKQLVLLRTRFLVTGDPQTPRQTAYSVMVENIPPQLRTNQALKEYFKMMFPGQVHCCIVLCQLDELTDLVSERDALLPKLERALLLRDVKGEQPQMRVFENGSWRQVNALIYLSSKLEELNSSIEAEQRKVRQATQGEDATISQKFGYFKRLLHLRPLRLSQSSNSSDASPSNSKAPAPAPTIIQPTPPLVPIFKSTQTTNTASSSQTPPPTPPPPPPLPPPPGLQEDIETIQQILEGFEDDPPAVTTTDDALNVLASGALTDYSQDTEAENDHNNPTDSLEEPLLRSVQHNLRNSLWRKVQHGVVWCMSWLSSAEEQEMVDELDSCYLPPPISQSKIGRLPIKAMTDVTRQTYQSAALFGNAAVRSSRAIKQALLLLASDRFEKSGTGFVTFNSLTPVVACRQLHLSNSFPEMSISRAPEPADIVWSNITRTPTQIFHRRGMTFCVLMGTAVVWSSVIAFLVMICDISHVWNHLPKKFRHGVSVEDVDAFSGFVSSLATMLFMNLLPYVLSYVAEKYEGRKTFSAIQKTVCRWYFVFQMANMLVGVTTTSYVSVFSESMLEPLTLIREVGTQLPNSTAYFSQLVIAYVLSGLPLELLRVGPFLFSLFRMFALSIQDSRLIPPRLKRETCEPEPEWIYPIILLVFMVSITFSMISPLLVLPASTLYFWGALYVYKYQCLFYFEPRYQSGGSYFFVIFPRLLIGLVLAQVLLASHLYSRGLNATASTILPLPLAVGAFYRYCTWRFKPHALCLALDVARTVDATMEFPTLLKSDKRAAKEEGGGDSVAGPSSVDLFTTPKAQMVKGFKRKTYLQPELFAPRAFARPYGDNPRNP